jgi:hypothetical protein
MAHGGDADWEMFCRGRRDEAFGGVADAEPVTLEPPEEPVQNEDRSVGEVRHFFAPVVGLPYPNPDGTSRREAVRGLRPWERVHLVHRPDNPVDGNAVAVLRASDGRQLGFLPATLAAEVVEAARGGTRYLALVSEVTGAGDDLISVAPVRARLLVLVLESGATKAQARRYFLERFRATPAASAHRSPSSAC